MSRRSAHQLRVPVRVESEEVVETSTRLDYSSAFFPMGPPPTPLPALRGFSTFFSNYRRHQNQSRLGMEMCSPRKKERTGEEKSGCFTPFPFGAPFPLEKGSGVIPPFDIGGCIMPPGENGFGVTGDDVPLPFLGRYIDPGRLMMGRPTPTLGRPFPMEGRMIGLAVEGESERSSTSRSPRSVKKGLASLYEPSPG